MTRQNPFARADRQQAHDGQREPWFQIRNETDSDTTRVLVYGVIGGFWDGVDAAEFAREFTAIDTPNIEIHLNSPGGYVDDGIAIANTIRQHPSTVSVWVDGLAASAASFIAVSGDELVMGRNTELMIHDALALCIGNAADLREYADDLDRVSSNIASMYAEKAGGDAGDWRELMLAETWYTPEEAVTAGLADRVDTSRQRETEDAAKTRFDLSMFAHAGRAHAPAPVAKATPAPPAEPADHTNPNRKESAMSDTLLNGLRDRLGLQADAELSEDQALAALDEALAERADTDPASAPGTVTLDQGQYDALRADAQAGREARDQQVADARTATVDAAVNDGRIPPARREHWLNQLTADPGAAEVLATLQPGGALPTNLVGHGSEESNQSGATGVRESAEYKNWSI